MALFNVKFKSPEDEVSLKLKGIDSGKFEYWERLVTSYGIVERCEFKLAFEGSGNRPKAQNSKASVQLFIELFAHNSIIIVNDLFGVAYEAVGDLYITEVNHTSTVHFSIKQYIYQEQDERT